MMLCLFVIGVVALCIYYALSYNFNYWKKRGVPHPPVSLLFGNINEAVFMKKSLAQVYTKIYNDYPHLPYVGFYKARQPGIIVREPELIKEVLVKSFNNFHDNDFLVDEKADPLFSRNPFVLRGHAWKTTRNQITPSFTSKRMKEMFPLIEAVCNGLVKYLEETPMGTDGLEAKDLAGKYTTDVVATCAFGLEANSFRDPNAEFRQMGKKLLTPTFMSALKFLIFFICPSLATWFEVKFVSDDLSKYFMTIVEKSLEYRKKHGVQRGDFLDAMFELKNKLGEDKFDNVDITAHALGFFVDGFETSSVVISFMLYELADNPDIQNRLREEIDATAKANGGKFSYDAVQEMTFLDKVFTEAARKQPAVLFLAKLCTEQFTLPLPGASSPNVVIEPGTRVIIPVYGIHRDPKYYPEPDRFYPERFSDVNKEKLTKNTFLSFGDGPRVCLGQRFGILQSKMAVVYIIKHFEVRINSKTITPIEQDPRYFLNSAKGGLWLNFFKRR